MDTLTAEPNLAELAGQINAQHARAEAATVRMAAASADVLLAARRAGDLLSQAKRAVGRAVGHGAWTRWVGANVHFSPRTAQVYMQLSQGWERIEAKCEAAQPLSIRQAIALAAERPPEDDAGRGPFVSNNGGSFEWYTPPRILAAARRVLGEIDVDPASCKAAQANVKAKKYFTLDDDGLAQKWRGRCWMNPPFKVGLLDKFVYKLLAHYKAGDVTAAILLVNNVTESRWFQAAEAACSAICFPAGRIKFIDEEGRPGAPLQGQSLLFFGADASAFEREFKAFGFVR